MCLFLRQKKSQLKKSKIYEISTFVPKKNIFCSKREDASRKVTKSQQKKYFFLQVRSRCDEFYRKGKNCFRIRIFSPGATEKGKKDEVKDHWRGCWEGALVTTTKTRGKQLSRLNDLTKNSHCQGEILHWFFPSELHLYERLRAETKQHDTRK